MRLLGRGLGALGLALGAWWFWQHADTLLPARNINEQTGDVAVGYRALAYELVPGQWLQFPVEAYADPMFRFVTNLNVRAAEQPEPDEVLEYTLEYTLIDAAGKVVERESHVHRTQVSRYLTGDDDATTQVAAYYLDRTAIPADGRVLLVNFAHLPNISAVRLRLTAKADSAVDAVLRAYQRERVPEFKLGNRWERLSEAQHAVRARGNVYPPEFLTREEKLALMRFRWNPAAPLGVEGVDFRQRQLYVRRDWQAEAVRDPVLPYGLLVEPGFIATLPVPGAELPVLFEFEPLEDGPPVHVALRWREDETKQHGARSIEVSDAPTALAMLFERAALLEISASAAITVRAQLTGADGRNQDITPQDTYVRAFRVGADATLDYALSHVGSASTPLRLDVRTLLEATQNSASATLELDLLRADGTLQQSVSCGLAFVPSRFDRARLEDDDRRLLSDPARCHVWVPQTVAQVRVSASDEVLVNAYTRPPDLVREVEVPQDYASYQSDHARVPAWFYLRPTARERLVREGRNTQLTVRTRPIEEDPDIAAGNYRWDEFRPQGPWAARFVLNARDETTPIRDQAIASAFAEVPPNVSLKVDLQPGAGRRGVQPRVIYVRERSDPVTVTIELDGKTVLDQQVRGRSGELRLPRVSPGRHDMTLRTEQALRFYVNHLRARPASAARRLAVRIGREPMRFIYAKRFEREVLTGLLQRAIGAREALRLRVNINAHRARGPAAGPDWTALRRRYVVHAAEGAGAPVLGGRDLLLDAGRRFYVPLNGDLPAGEYAIEVWLENAADAYLSLYRLTPGAHEREIIFSEQDGFDSDD